MFHHKVEAKFYHIIIPYYSNIYSLLSQFDTVMSESHSKFKPNHHEIMIPFSSNIDSALYHFDAAEMSFQVSGIVNLDSIFERNLKSNPFLWQQ